MNPLRVLCHTLHVLSAEIPFFTLEDLFLFVVIWHAAVEFQGIILISTNFCDFQDFGVLATINQANGQRQQHRKANRVLKEDVVAYENWNQLLQFQK